MAASPSAMLRATSTAARSRSRSRCPSPSRADRIDDHYAANLRGLATLREIARAKDITVPQLALAWLLAQGDDIVPIPGTRSARRIAENARAAEVVLGPDEIAAVRAAFPDGAFGARYVQSLMPAWV